MIVLKSPKEIELMRASARVSEAAMDAVLRAVRPGVSTRELDGIAYDVITRAGATPSFLNYRGFPGTVCASVNEQVVHGIPSNRKLREGDIISIDLGSKLHGYHSDMARTIGVGEIAPEHQRLIAVTKQCFYKGMAAAKAGNRIGDIGRAVQTYAEGEGMGVVRELVGHGIGQEMHQAPDVPNFVGRSRGPAIRPGMTLAIEPMINLGTGKVRWGDDGWTVTTADGEYSAHYENTIVVTENGPEFITEFDETAVWPGGKV